MQRKLNSRAGPLNSGSRQVPALLVPKLTSFNRTDQVSINNAILPLIQSAIGGINVGRCASHPCTTKTGQEPVCGRQGLCQPRMDNFSCECPLGRIGSRCEMTLDLASNIDNLTSSSSSSSSTPPTPVPYFNGDSFLHFNDEEMAKK